MKKTILMIMLLTAGFAYPKEYHVAKNGAVGNDGTPNSPLLTVQAASELAQPGDIITVHTGAYRERIDPPRGGSSNDMRITYRANPGEEVILTGSEIVKNWISESGNIWRVSLPNSMFGSFNPYSDTLHGDWFDNKGRKSHTGAVYLNGDWMLEAVTKTELEKYSGTSGKKGVSHFGETAGDAILFNGVKNGGSLTIWYSNGLSGTSQASLYINGVDVQTLRFDATGGWLNYKSLTVTVPVTGSVAIKVDNDDDAANPSYCCNVDYISIDGTKYEAENAALTGAQLYTDTNPFLGRWYAEVKSDSTTLWGVFELNPNEQLVEINVRQSVFYPAQTGKNFITVRGFTMRHAATPWAPPTAGQIGLIGTNWSKGWIIENNTISHSMCVGITLGKYSDEFDNTSNNGAGGYVETINRALKNGWNKATIGSHLVRNNTIFRCEQAAIVGSLGAVFSTVTGNTIYDIYQYYFYGGAEMAGIKFHAAIDLEISNNHIFRASRGIWLDWMAQGTRVTRNIMHDNNWDDLFLEVNHGPTLIDNNLFLSGAIHSWSSGNAFVHNLIAGDITVQSDGRQTPYHVPHSTEVVALHSVPSGDARWYNNIFFSSRADLSVYDNTQLPNLMGGNVFLNGAKACKTETSPLNLPTFNPAIKFTQAKDSVYLEMNSEEAWRTAQSRKCITTAILGQVNIVKASFEDPAGQPLTFDTDFFGNPRNKSNPFPGPFEQPLKGKTLVFGGNSPTTGLLPGMSSNQSRLVPKFKSVQIQAIVKNQQIIIQKKEEGKATTFFTIAGRQLPAQKYLKNLSRCRK